MKPKHTPGPWVVTLGSVRGQYDTVEKIESSSGRVIMNGGHPFRADEEQLANAHLIAAAPEMLWALKHLLNGYNQGAVKLDAADVQLIQQTIAKAEGRES